MDTNFLTKIFREKSTEVRNAKRTQNLTSLFRAVHSVPAPRGFLASLASSVSIHGIGLIGEIKKASPSAGVINTTLDIAATAQTYQQAGVACLSVLTDGPYFHGCKADLQLASRSVSIPTLRKDFMVDPWQIVESRSLGADCVLVIMAMLDDFLARELVAVAHELKLDVIVEIHDLTELNRAMSLPGTLAIGINSRNLRDMSVDLSTIEQIAPLIPKSRCIIGESGIRTRQDIERLRNCNVHAFLVGEALMRTQQPGAVVNALLGIQ